MKCAINIIFLLGPIFIPRAAAIRNSVILSMAWFFFLQHWFIFIRFFQDHVYIRITSHVLRVKHSREREREKRSFHIQLMDCRLQLLNQNMIQWPGEYSETSIICIESLIIHGCQVALKQCYLSHFPLCMHVDIASKSVFA